MLCLVFSVMPMRKPFEVLSVRWFAGITPMRERDRQQTGFAKSSPHTKRWVIPYGADNTIETCDPSRCKQPHS
jgi:hypothetical protein